jgi:hypothetical protein
VQDGLEKSKKTTFFKLTLPKMGNELKVAIWVSGTPEQFLLHVHNTMHMCKQMGLEMNFANAEMAVTSAEVDAKLVKTKYAQVCSSKKKKKKNNKSESTISDFDALTSTKANNETAVKSH